MHWELVGVCKCGFLVVRRPLRLWSFVLCFYLCPSSILIWILFSFSSSRQLPVPVAIHVAKMLEHESKSCTQPALPRKRTVEVLATWNHGRSNIFGVEGRLVLVPGRQEVRYSLSYVCSLRKSSAQHVRTFRRWWIRWGLHVHALFLFVIGHY